MTDELLSLSNLAKRLPAIRGGKPPSRNTLYTWATKGLKSRSGHRIRLETQFVGGILCATLDDVLKLGERKDDRDWSPPKIPITDREREHIAKRGRDAIAALRKRREAISRQRP